MKSPFELTEKELAVFQDMEFMPLKAKVWHKIEALLSQLQQQLEKKIPEYSVQLPKELIYSSGKLSRGENYKTYSYRVMDYPRAFQGADIFTFRCVVLWGYPIGFHFILKGSYKDQFQMQLLEKATQYEHKIWLSDQIDPWAWEADDPQQILLTDELSDQLKQKVAEKSFLKLSHYLPTEKYDEIPDRGVDFWAALCESFI